MTKHQITEEELKIILNLLDSSDIEVKQLAIELLKTYDWTGLRDTQYELFWIIYNITIGDDIEMPVWMVNERTFTSYNDEELSRIIKHWKNEKKNRSRII